MCCLILINTGRGYQHRGHHGKGAKRRRNHITHHITVIILAGPDETSLCFHDSGYRIIDQRIEIGDSCILKLRFKFLFIYLLENILKVMIIFLGNSILSCKPQILLRC